MLACSVGPSATEGPVEQTDFGNAVHFHPPPVGQWPAAGACELVAQQLHCSLVHSVIVGLDDARLSLVGQLHQTLLLNCGAEHLVDLCVRHNSILPTLRRNAVHRMLTSIPLVGAVDRLANVDESRWVCPH